MERVSSEKIPSVNDVKGTVHFFGAYGAASVDAEKCPGCGSMDVVLLCKPDWLFVSSHRSRAAGVGIPDATLANWLAAECECCGMTWWRKTA